MFIFTRSQIKSGKGGVLSLLTQKIKVYVNGEVLTDWTYLNPFEHIYFVFNALTQFKSTQFHVYQCLNYSKIISFQFSSDQVMHARNEISATKLVT